jgi:hypothetical protein
MQAIEIGSTMSKEIKTHYRGVGTIHKQPGEQVSLVFYSFDLEAGREDRRISGVVITREATNNIEGALLLKSEEGYCLRLLSVKAILGQEAGFYSFTAELLDPYEIDPASKPGD